MLFDGYGGNTGLTGAWSMDGTVSIGGTSYNVYNHSTTQAQVLVKSTVTTVNMLTSPIMLDLNQDGVFSTQQVAMDVNSDGHMDLTTWAGQADGVLVWDKGGDRKVTNVSEYAFTQYGGNTDLEGLRAGFDSNGDGVSDAGEVKTLAELGITSVNLTSNGKTDASQAGMLVHGTTTAQTAHGAVQVADAEFTYQTLQEKPMTLELQVPVESLPGEPTLLINGDASQELMPAAPFDESLVTLNLVGLNDVQLSLDNLGATLANLSGNAKPDLLHLNVSDVLQLQTTATGVHQLEVLGDANDVVDLSSLFADGHTEGQWQQGGQVTQNGHTFNVYQYSGDQTLQVLIDQHIVQSNVHLS